MGSVPQDEAAGADDARPYKNGDGAWKAFDSGAVAPVSRTSHGNVVTTKIQREHVQQRQPDDCGICAVATAAYCSYERALAAVFPDADTYPGKNVVRLTWATRAGDIRAGLTRLGKDTGCRIVNVVRWEQITKDSIVAIGFRSTEFHWVFYDHTTMMVYDPKLTEPLHMAEYFYLPSAYIPIR